MKAKLKGASGIKGLALLHGEKIAIGLVGLIAMYFVYSSLSVPSMPSGFEATDLQNKISATNTQIQATRWPEAGSPEIEQVRIARSIEQNANMSVPESLVSSNPANLNPPIIKPTILRTDPPLLNVEDVKAIGGSGLFAFIDLERQKQFQIEERRKQEELDLKQQQDAERNAEMQPDQPQRGNRRNRQNQGGPEGFANEERDPDRPNRRPIQGQIMAAGAQLQGGERIERRFWATVVAKVPVREQEKLYAAAFENAKGGYDPSRDMPNYLGYRVERAEVISGQPLAWKPVPVYDGQENSQLLHPSGMSDKIMMLLRDAALKNWAANGSTTDPVDTRYLDPILTFPLPPLVGRNFGADATHPDIPLATNAVLETPEEMTPAGMLPEQPAADGELEFGTGVPGQMPAGPEFMGPVGRGPMMSEFGGPEGGMGYGAGGGPLARGVDYRLFRFIDFTVEPGKRYKYRVKLILRDPNYGVDKNFLAPEVLDRKTKVFREVTEWSEPSTTVGIPLSGSVRLAQVKPKTDKANDEPSVSLLVEAFDLDEQGVPIQAGTMPKEAFRRGSVANVTADGDFVEATGQFVDKLPGFKFRTGMTVLDIVGGEKLAGTRDMTVPARVLLMGPAGELYIRNEIDDKPSVEYHRQVFTVDKNKESMPGAEYGLEGGGGMRGRGPR